MANKVLITEQDGTPVQICFRNETDFAPTAAKDLRKGSPTLVQILLGGLADTAARQSTKVDLGTDRARLYSVRAALEIAATPTAGDVVELYWAPSSSATAGTGNAANVTGVDGTYDGYSANLAASVLQLQFIGNFVCTAQATPTIQVAEVGVFMPTQRYGSLIVKNESAAAFFATDSAEFHVVFDPIVEEIQ